MDYYNHRCPVCKNTFEKDSEIVVCPRCGTPHHRDCYDETGHCHFEDKHAEGFDWTAQAKSDNTNTDYNKNQKTNHNTNHRTHQSSGSDIIACKECGTFNVASNKVCNNCGAPLENDTPHNPYDRHSQEHSTPPFQGAERNPQQPFPGFVFDPMGGLNAEEDLGKGVTVGEVAKFTKNNTPFYCRLFHQIKSIGKSRLSFVGFIFHGGWLLYRKMYKLGTFITALMALMIISQLWIGTFYADLMENLAKSTESMSYASMFDAIGDFYQSIDAEEQIVLAVYAFSSIGQFVLRIICALCGNRWYYKHCIKKISDIKTKPETKDNAAAALQTKGGVNNTLAISLLITYSLLSFLPYFF